MSSTEKNNLPQSPTYWADLHLHTHASDGLYTPKQLVELAVEKGLCAIGITDHDAVRSIKPAIEEAESYNLEIIPGVELSTVDRQLDVHILGYFIDIKNKRMLHYIQLFQEERVRRAKKIVAKLYDLGMKLNLDLIMQNAGPGSIGRPHIADALMEEGYVLSYDEAFYKFLGNNKPAYVPKYKISPSEGIELIQNAGGLSFLAHPGLDITTETIAGYIKLGLDGIEIRHPKHSQHKVNELYQFAIRHELLVSGGSDCHGNRKGQEMMGLFNVPYQFVDDMKQKLEIIKGMSSVTITDTNEKM